MEQVPIPLASVPAPNYSYPRLRAIDVALSYFRGHNPHVPPDVRKYDGSKSGSRVCSIYEVSLDSDSELQAKTECGVKRERIGK